MEWAGGDGQACVAEFGVGGEFEGVVVGLFGGAEVDCADGELVAEEAASADLHHFDEGFGDGEGFVCGDEDVVEVDAV